MFVAVTFAILITMGLALARALIGPSVYDRIAAANMFGTKTVLLIAVFAFLSGRTDLLDIALVYALINFIGVIAVLRLVEYGDFHSSQLPTQLPTEHSSSSQQPKSTPVDIK